MHKSSFYRVCSFAYWISLFILSQKKSVFFFSRRTSSSQTSSTEKMNISFLKDPGVYEILEVKKNFSCYGETSCLLNRFQIHLRQLKKGTHPCTRLLESFQEQNNEEGFQFFVRASGPEWHSAEKRREFQDRVVEENSSRCYNQTEEDRAFSSATQIRAIMYKGRRYDSVRGAIRYAEHVKISRTRLKRQLIDPKIDDVYYLEEQKQHGSIPLFGQKENGPVVFFPSIRAAVRAGFARNRAIATRMVQQNIGGWRYAAVDENGNPLRTYKLQKDDFTYKRYLEQLLEKNEF